MPTMGLLLHIVLIILLFFHLNVYVFHSSLHKKPKNWWAVNTTCHTESKMKSTLWECLGENQTEIELVHLPYLSKEQLTPHYKHSEPGNQTGKFRLRRLHHHLWALLAVHTIFLKENFQICCFTPMSKQMWIKIKTLYDFIKFMEIFSFLFLLNLLGWHWLISLYRFPGYTSMVHDLYIALCAHHLKSNHLRHHIFGPLYPLLPAPTNPLPSGNHQNVICVYKFQIYIPHMSEVTWFLAFSNWLFCLACYSQVPSMLSQWLNLRIAFPQKIHSRVKNFLEIFNAWKKYIAV